MLTEFQLWVLTATEIVALYIVCVMLLRAVIPGQIKWAPKCLAYGALNRLAGVLGASRLFEGYGLPREEHRTLD